MGDSAGGLTMAKRSVPLRYQVAMYPSRGEKRAGGMRGLVEAGYGTLPTWACGICDKVYHGEKSKEAASRCEMRHLRRHSQGLEKP
jgi:hypothetical protein